MDNESDKISQLDLFPDTPSVVHFWDKNGALHTGHIIKKIKKGKRKGQYIVCDSSGKRYIPTKIRNIETR